MEIVNTIELLRSSLSEWRREGLRIALVPTMGHLHDGHLSLIKMAQENADRVIATIYINPMQFDRPDDLSAYPRTMESDVQQLRNANVDLLFTPDDSVIYPGGHSDKTRIDVPGMTDVLCGAHRPGHFVGVATIVCKLFNMVQPDVAVFGEKDYQQLMIVRQMTSDLNLPVEVLGAPTWRESSGLAMSSRNSYLNQTETQQAAALYQALCRCADAIVGGDRDYSMLEQSAMSELEQAGFSADYVSIRRRSDLELPLAEEPSEAIVILAAAFLGKARLIDNLQVNQYMAQGNLQHDGIGSQSNAAG